MYIYSLNPYYSGTYTLTDNTLTEPEDIKMS